MPKWKKSSRLIPPLFENIPTVNAIQAMLGPAIAPLVASMMANIEVMRVSFEELDTEQRDSCGKFASRSRQCQKGRGYFNGCGRGHGHSTSRDRRTFQHSKQYCHTHGTCNHASSECNRKTPGHKNKATFPRRMGGSNDFCQAAAAPAVE